MAKHKIRFNGVYGFEELYDIGVLLEFYGGQGGWRKLGGRNDITLIFDDERPVVYLHDLHSNKYMTMRYFDEGNDKIRKEIVECDSDGRVKD